jgi:hypothetical protein
MAARETFACARGRQTDALNRASPAAATPTSSGFISLHQCA